MFTTTVRVDEGWYPDPDGGLYNRYWNGTEWTSQTRDIAGWLIPAEQPNTPVSLLPPETGWASVAFALHSALCANQPVTLTITLTAPQFSKITINTFTHNYFWENETEQLPELTIPAGIVFAPGDTVETPGARNLDGLLWRISAVAFPDRLAPWLHSDDLYRMHRWPNLTTINPELDDMRQAAMLANGMFTVDELTGFSDRNFPDTQRLINALSLMNTLKIATPRDGSLGLAGQKTTPASLTPVQRPSLFQRLRARLGL